MAGFQFPLDKWMEITTDIARQGGLILKKYWGKLENIRTKDFVADMVTEADKQTEEVILKALKKHFPDHSILAEESGSTKNGESDFVWIVDPLDGTTNYTHQYPVVSISIGLVYKNEPILGVVYNPITEEMYQAYKGSGASLNGVAIHVSKINNLGRSLLATGFPYDRLENPDNNYAEFCHLTDLTQGVRRGGSAALDLALVASGCLDGYWERIKPWDVTAGIVLVREAGGQVTEYDLSHKDIFSERILATNGLLQEAISLELLKVRGGN